MPKKQYPLRLDAELYDVIEQWANDEFRSVNAHIEFLLRDAAKRAGRLRKKPLTNSNLEGNEDPRD